MCRLLETKERGPNLGEAGSVGIREHAEYLRILEELERMKHVRHDFIRALTQEQLALPIQVTKDGTLTPLGDLVLGLLDHEAHHRGQLATYLRLLEAKA